ncbi:MAG: amidohydrolase [Hyphomonadaceae bacterium]|nr:amidohydrolase [Hyphomonadaceae bacterium]
MRTWTLGIAGALAAATLATAAIAQEAFRTVRPPTDPYPSTYTVPTAAPVIIRGATVIDGEGGEFASTDVLIADGKIAAVGQALPPPAGAQEIDGRGKFVTPGIIDAHSHLGVYPSPGIQASSDGNEATQPNTAEVWAEHSVWPQDPGFSRAVAGGITTLHVLPGSANLFGGRGVTLHPVLGARTVQSMKVPGAPYTLKMACGENPSRVYGGRNSSPATGMGNVAGWRQSFAKAQEYDRKWKEYWRKAARFEPKEDEPKGFFRAKAKDKKGAGDPPVAPDRDLEMETLAAVLNGEILVQWHCYRADEMATALDIAKEFGFRVAAFHHAVESYKIGDLLARDQTCSAMWADWWGFKLEAYDGIRENIPFVHARGACAIVHSDSEVGIQRLNQEAAKALADGRRAGLQISRADAWRWLSLNPATAIGISDRTGSLKVGKAGDVVVWSADPLSSYAVAERVFINGAQMYERGQVVAPPSDFELGQSFRERAR